MARLAAGNIREILQLLEEGVRLIPTISKSEKVAMRSRIRKQYAWLSGLVNPTAATVVHDLEKRLPDLFPHYPYGFADQLHEFLKKKLGR